MLSLDSLVISGVTTQDNNIDDLINIPNLKRLWISPDIYLAEDYAKFEALKFKIYDEYDNSELSKYEEELYGFYISNHPTSKYIDEASITCENIKKYFCFFVAFIIYITIF